MEFSCPALEIQSYQHGRGSDVHNFCNGIAELDKIGVKYEEQIRLFREALRYQALYLGGVYSPIFSAPRLDAMCELKEDCPIRKRLLKINDTSTE